MRFSRLASLDVHYEEIDSSVSEEDEFKIITKILHYYTKDMRIYFWVQFSDKTDALINNLTFNYHHKSKRIQKLKESIEIILYFETYFEEEL
jgi:hypothetical protein